MFSDFKKRKSNKPIESDTDLVAEMTRLSRQARFHKQKIKDSRDLNKPSDFYKENDYLALGPAFTLVPPYVQI